MMLYYYAYLEAHDIPLPTEKVKPLTREELLALTNRGKGNGIDV